MTGVPDMGERFRAYLDDELTPDERSAFEADLAASPETEAEFEDYRRTVELLRGLPMPEPPDRFLERVEGRIRRRSHGRFFGVEPRVRLPYEAIATITLLAAMVLIFMRAAPPVERPVLRAHCADPAIAADVDRAAEAFGAFGDVTTRADCRLRVAVPREQVPSFLEALGRDWAGWEAVERRDDGERRRVEFLVRRKE